MSPTRAARSERQDRIIRAMVVVTLCVVVAGFLIGLATIWQVLNQGSTLDAQARSDALAGCRSEFAADLATAEAELARAEARQGDVIFLGLVEYAQGDDAGVREAVADSPQIQAAIVDAREVRDTLDDERRAALALARSDPDAFLAQCERRFG